MVKRAAPFGKKRCLMEGSVWLIFEKLCRVDTETVDEREEPLRMNAHRIIPRRSPCQRNIGKDLMYLEGVAHDEHEEILLPECMEKARVFRPELSVCVSERCRCVHCL